MKIADILRICADDDYEDKSCVEFIVEALHIPADNWDSHITLLLQRMQVISNLTETERKTRDILITCLDKFQRCLRQLHVVTAEDFMNFLQRDKLQTDSLELLLTNLECILVQESVDIQNIAASLVPKENPTYLLGYTSITSKDIITVPAGIVTTSGCVTSEVNMGSKGKTCDWIFSSVTSNLDEDLLAGRGCKNTTLKPRNKLYPVFTRISRNNINGLRKLIPNYDDTCIPTLKCIVVPLF